MQLKKIGITLIIGALITGGSTTSTIYARELQGKSLFLRVMQELWV